MSSKTTLKRRTLTMLLAGSLCVLASCGTGTQSTPEPTETQTEETGIYTAGTYTAAGRGMNGDVPVTVTFSAIEILNVEVGENQETQDIGTKAIEQLPEAIVAAQAADVDVVSGATVTSNAILEAVEQCIAQAKGEETADEISFNPGTYTAQVTGMAGQFDVTVTFGEDTIDSVEVGENNETLMVGTEAIRILSQRIVDSQSLDVDAVTGATYTSMAVISGVKDCVEQAGGSVTALQNVPVTVDTYAGQTHEADILIVGGGLAGITAALSAAENGGNVILLEEKEYLGGNSVLSTGSFIFAGTSIQAGLGIEDDPQAFVDWELEVSENAKDPVQVAMVAFHGQELIDFFASLGVNFNTEQVSPTDGSDVARGHSLSPNIGTGVSTLVAQLENLGVDIRYSTKVDGLIQDETGTVTGVTATDYYGNPVEYYGKAVVLASGGFGDNNDMIVENWGEEYDGLVYGGAKGMDGAMLQAAVALGADTVDMDDAHIDATLEVTKGITITTNLLRNCGGILIRQSTGQRFADEQASHSEEAAAAMHDLGDPYYYEIFDNDAFTYSESVTAKAESYVNMGLTTQYDSIEEMAEGIGVDPEVLTQTIEDYNAVVRGEQEDPFGRERFGATEMTAPFYVMKVSNGVACTTGGLKIDENFRVLTTEGEAIPNLYAIGEITGGARVHYVGGDSLSNAAVGGMLAGIQLAEAFTQD